MCSRTLTCQSMMRNSAIGIADFLGAGFEIFAVMQRSGFATDFANCNGLFTLRHWLFRVFLFSFGKTEQVWCLFALSSSSCMDRGSFHFNNSTGNYLKRFNIFIILVCVCWMQNGATVRVSLLCLDMDKLSGQRTNHSKLSHFHACSIFRHLFAFGMHDIQLSLVRTDQTSSNSSKRYTPTRQLRACVCVCVLCTVAIWCMANGWLDWLVGVLLLWTVFKIMGLPHKPRIGDYTSRSLARVFRVYFTR